MSDATKNGGNDGARIHQFDQRVSRGISLFMGCIGVAALGVVSWAAMSINELNVNVARLVVRLDAKESRDDSQDLRIYRAEESLQDVRGDVRALEARAMRGEARRGQ